MKKRVKIISGILITAFIVISYAQYKSNSRLKDALGSTYISNITVVSHHINRIKIYLENEKEFKEGDSRHYYYEVNSLLLVKLPSDNYIENFIQFIQLGIIRIDDLISNGGSESEIEEVRKHTLQLVNLLYDGLKKMSDAGKVKIGESNYLDYKRYYQLSLPGNRTMESINNDLKKQLDKHIEYLNQQ